MSEGGTKFRSDINALRAYAVLAVMLFHFRMPGFDGGFVGVDIFFVISGFLMTQILVNRIKFVEAGSRASWLFDFYLSRARRIIPALVVLCIVLLFTGWFLLLSYDLRKLSAQIVSALTFLSNVKFWRDGDGEYFGSVANEKFLLHTWSLSVEWQFYLFYPLVVLFIWRMFRSDHYRHIAIASAFMASAILSIVITPFKPTFAFYLLPTRAWELLAGALVFIMPAQQWAPRFAKTTESAGFLLIFLSVVLFDEATVWPGFLAIVPVLGTALVLLSAQQNSLWTRSSVLQALGNWSYSIYLWHWPFAVVLVYLELTNDLSLSLSMLALAIIFGAASYAWVETPTRRFLAQLPPIYTVASIAISALGIILPALVIHQRNGMPDRVMPFNLSKFEATYDSRRDECISKGDVFRHCIYGTGKLSAILVGDSHAGSTVTAVQRALPDNSSLELFSFPGCITLFGQIANDSCSYFNERVLEKLTNPSTSKIPLIIVSRVNDSNSEYLRNIVSSACLVAANRPVWLVRPLPNMQVEVPRIAAYRTLLGSDINGISVSLFDYHQRHELVWEAQAKAAAQCNVHILDPLPYLCDSDKCSGLKESKPLYYDAYHLSEYGNKFLVPMFREVFEVDLVPSSMSVEINGFLKNEK